MTEAILQKNVTKCLNQTLQNNVFWTSVEVSNGRGGKYGAINQKALARRGVKSGFPDVFLLWLDDGLKALFIELKWKNNGLQETQIKCHADIVEKLHAPVVVCRSVYDVIEALEVYNVPTRIKELESEKHTS